MVEIRKLATGDNELYRSLWLVGITEHATSFRVAVEDEPAPSIPTLFAPDSFTLGAFVGSDLVGIVSFERDTRKKLRHKALLFRMFVRSDMAGQGVGHALIKTVSAEAKTLHGLRYVYLTVLASNERAIRLYSSCGFHQFAQEVGGVRIGDQFVDELQMASQVRQLRSASPREARSRAK